MYDVVRLDHFRGFESYWAIPAGDSTAAGGSWQPGPAMDFIRAIQKALPDLEFIAEDLGYVTAEVRALQEGSGYPGMKVLQFAFDSREAGDYLPHTYPKHSVCYSGTHDNLTLVQWLQEAAAEDIAMAREYLGLSEEEGLVTGLIRGCMGSVSDLCIVQMQDYLELGGEARMNFPGTLSSANWTWRAEEGFLTEALTEKIRNTTQLYGRM
jgi:4-alpha-glucanotransferase